MEKKIIAIVFGGFSGERAISEKSAQVVKKYLSHDRWDSYLVDIDVDSWEVVIDQLRIPVLKDDFSFTFQGRYIKFDGVFNAIHGTPGEDGKIQGYFDVLGIPYNNCNLLASAITFDKSACNRYLAASGINVAKSYIVRYGDDFNSEEIIQRVGLPCFVKPSDGGSSLGVSKVKHQEDLPFAITKAQADGVSALIESFLDGTEVSCGCIKIDGKPRALAVTEIVPANEFFDYDSKYHNSKTQEITPARLTEENYREVIHTTEKIYHYLNCSGMIRIDFMVCKNGVYLIEVNTTPGLSEASIIPQQAKYAGFTLQEFFDHSVAAMYEQPTALEKIKSK